MQAVMLITFFFVLGSLRSATSARVQGDLQNELPSIPLSDGILHMNDWWAHDGKVVYYPPPSTHEKLSHNISNYYYAYGSKSAIPAEMAKHRVGGSGRVHIFHVPQHTSSDASTSVARKRGSSLSGLMPVMKGTALAELPPYTLPRNAKDPFDKAALAKEAKIMKFLNEPLYKKFFDEMTDPESALLKVRTRNWENTQATRQVRDFLKNEFESMGLTTCVQKFDSWPHKYNIHAGGNRVYNVIGMSPGTEPGSVTIGAHFDSLPGWKAGVFPNAPGAVDNGSGTAAVLAMARAFAKAKLKTKKTLYFVAFGGEEENLYGSDYFAASLIKGNAPKSTTGTKATLSRRCQAVAGGKHSAITMDMIGWRNPEFPADTVTLETKDWAKDLLPGLKFSNDVNNGKSLKLLVQWAPYGSDHESFLIRGMKAMLAIDNDGDAEAYPCYHQSCDTPDNVNTRLATEIARMNLGGALRLAGL